MSRLITPQIAAGSRRRAPIVVSVIFAASTTAGLRFFLSDSASLRLLPGEQDEHVFQRGGATHGVVGNCSVDGALGTDHRDGGPRRPYAQALRLSLLPGLG